MWCFLEPPKCYTLINKMYDPIADMRRTREKLNILNEKMEEMFSEEQENEFMKIVAMYIDNDDMPKMGSLYHQVVTERLELLRHLKNLRTEYPRHHKRLMAQESRKFRERLNMMNEDDDKKS